jgi:Tfp pilus assembly protein PilN
MTTSSTTAPREPVSPAQGLASPRTGAGGEKGSGSRWAVVGCFAGNWGVLVLDGLPLRVVQKQTWKSADDGADKQRVLSAITGAKVRRVLWVANVHETTARSVTLPADAQVESDSAGLFAEAYAPAGVASHRVAGGLLPGGRLLVTSWWGDGQAAAANAGAALGAALGAGLASAKVRELASTPAAGLAALVTSGAASATGGRLVWSEGDCVVAAAKGSKGVVVRQVLEDSDDGQWTEVVREVLAGVAAQAGLEGEVPAVRASTNGRSVLCVSALEGAAIDRVLSGAPREEVWRSELLPVLGCAVLLAGSDDVGSDAMRGLGTLAKLSRVELAPEMPALVRAGVWAGRAWPVLLGVAAALLVAAPIGLTWARANIAKQRTLTLDAAREKTKDIELKAAVYAQLETTRWPMSKMLADVSGVAPVGVSVKSLRMTVGQPVSMQGEAKDAEQVNALATALSEKLSFRNVKANRVSPRSQGEGVEFDLSAEIGNVHASITPAEDFAATPLAVRLYGEGATNTTMPVGAVKRVQRGGGRAAAATTAGGASGGSAGSAASGGSASGGSRRPAEAPANEPPAALTDEEIGKMTTGEAMRGWTTRRTYLSRNAGIDSGLKSRLEEEIRKLQEQQRKATSSGTTSNTTGSTTSTGGTR